MKDSSALAIVVIKESDYPNHMKNRRKDRDIRRYLPFNELQDLNNNSEATNKEIIKHLKTHSIINKEFFFQSTKLLFYFNRRTM